MSVPFSSSIDWGKQSPKQLADSYDALIEIIGESEAKERQFAAEYLDEVPNSAKSMNVRKRIIDGSRRCLEKSYVIFTLGNYHSSQCTAFYTISGTSLPEIRKRPTLGVFRRRLTKSGHTSGSVQPGRTYLRMAPSYVL